MSSNTVIFAVALGLLVGVAALLFARRGGASFGARLARAKAGDDVAPLLGWIDAHPASGRLDAFNTAIRRLWDDYERALATRLIRELGSRHAVERIAQYWLDQAQRVEPEIAAKVLDRAFLAEHFRPEVAARCGQFG